MAWDYRQILQIIDSKQFSDKDPYFTLDITALRDTRKSFHAITPLTSPDTPNKQPYVGKVRATCALTIWEGQGPSRRLVQQTVPCILHVQPQDSTERFAKVELKQPFRIYCQDLVSNEKVFTAQRFSMQLILQAADLQSVWPPVDLDKVPSPEKGVDLDLDGTMIRFPLLVTTYSRFPQCPSKDEEAVLHITASQDGKQYRPKLALQIDAKWVDPTTPADTYNVWKTRKHAQFLQAPTTAKKTAPSRARVTSPNVLVKIKMTWLLRFSNFRVIQNVFDGMLCPLCNGKKFENPLVYGLHLTKSHDLFDFVSKTRLDEKGGSFRVNVKVSIKQPYKIGEAVSSGGHVENGIHLNGVRELVNSQVPKTFDTFFDLQQYLRNLQGFSWTGEEAKNAQSFGTTPNSHSLLGFDSVRAGPTASTALSRPAKDVPDLLRPRRKKYPVQPAPEGVIFYSLRIKRPLEEGELLSESDDGMDNDWLLKKQDAQIDSFEDLTPEEKSFIKRHDRHMLRENINSNLHYREALVRFCRLNSYWLRQPKMRCEFAKKLAALQIEGVVRIQQVLEYWDIIDNPQLTKNKLDDDRLDTILEDDRPSVVQTNLRFFSKCAVCHKPIRSLEDSERCGNSTCPNECHKSCAANLFGPAEGIGTRALLCQICQGPGRAEQIVSSGGPNISNSNDSLQSRQLTSSGSSSQLLMESVSSGSAVPVKPEHSPRIPTVNDESSFETQGFRATDPNSAASRLDDYGIRLSNGKLGTGAHPIALEGEEDFPVGRDLKRIRQSQPFPFGWAPGHSRDEPELAAYPDPLDLRPAPQGSGYGVHGQFTPPIESSNRSYSSISTPNTTSMQQQMLDEQTPRPRRPHEL